MIFDPNPTLRWAFCMTHPDDEISICAWIKRLTTQGNSVFISWTHSNPVREAEGRNAATLMGVPQENLIFFGAPDGNVVSSIPQLIPQFKDWFQQVRPDRVCCGAFEQGHIDHDATNFLVSKTFDGPRYEIPFYHTYTTRLQTMNVFSQPSNEEVIALTPNEQSFKKAIAKQYPSQNIWKVLLWYEIWQRLRFRTTPLIAFERMREQTHRDFLRPNVPDRLLGRVARHRKWQHWTREIKQLVETD